MRPALLVVLLLVLVGCRKDPALVGSVPGEVLFFLRSGTSVAELYDLTQRHELELKEASSFIYEVDPSTADSDSVRTVLLTKRYLTRAGLTFGITTTESGTYVSANFFALGDDDQLDWEMTVQQLGLIERLDRSAWQRGTLLVPFGQEAGWLLRLRKEPIILNAQLNHYL